MDSWNFQYTLEADVDKRLIFEKIYGVWRIETARSYHADFKKEVTELMKKPWAKLIDLSNWKTSSPEVIRIVGGHLEWCRSNNMILSVNIINNPVTYKQLMKMFSKGATEKMSKTFRTRAEAETYLEIQGFPVKSIDDQRLFH